MRRLLRYCLLTLALVVALAGVGAVAALLFAPMTARRDAADWIQVKVGDVTGDNDACGSSCYRPTWYGYDDHTCSEPDIEFLKLGDVHVRNLSCDEVRNIIRPARRGTATLNEELEQQGFQVTVHPTCCGGDYLIADKSGDRSFELLVGD